MLLKPIAFAAAGLAAAQAFLLPPETTESDVNIANSTPDIITITDAPHHINLPCPGCLSQHKGKKHGYASPAKTAEDRPSHLELAFKILHEDNKPDKLVINTGLSGSKDAREIYPNPMSDMSPVMAHIALDKPSKIEKSLRGHSGGRHRNQPLGFSLSTYESFVNKDDGLQLIDLDFQVSKVGKKTVDVPNVHIMLVKDTKNGALVIGNVETISPTQDNKQDDCTGFVCKWLAAMMDKAEKMKAKCGGGKAKTHHQQHGGHPYKTHHHHIDVHRSPVAKFFKDLAVHVLAPVTVGILAGVGVSVLGMLIGSLIVSVWRVFFRSGERRRTPKASKKEVVGAEVEEKAGLMENQEDGEDAPPAYEDGVDVSPV